MRNLDIVIPVKNEEKNVEELSKQIHTSLTNAKVDYNMIFVVDLSTDNTLKVLRKLSEIYPITIHKKEGKPGKAFSIIEGTKLASSDHVAFIDGDLQYPPSALPELLNLAESENHGVVVANRKVFKAEGIRKIGSRINKFVFGKLLLGLDCDVQSGLKVFKREIFEHIDLEGITPWTFDMPLLHTAKELGYTIGEVDIDFEVRTSGASKVGFLKTALAIAKSAIKIKLRERKIFYPKREDMEAKLGSSLLYKQKHYVTHTKLPHHKSSVYTFKRWQKLFFALATIIFATALAINPIMTGIIFVAVLSAIYFADVLFTFFLTTKSLHFPPEISISDAELATLKDSALPVYTVMCPLYKEAEVIGHFVNSIGEMDWPKDKLDVMLLLEEDDKVTQEAAQNMTLPAFVRVVVVPDSQPKTKPKACNYGIHLAKGEYVVIYDAEDLPDPLQLKKAFLAFKKVPRDIVCIQGKLNYYNPHQNWLTKLFTAEYSLWFDVILPGLQSIYTFIPLGGTSNHFRTRELIRLNGWDPFNVTEDCDLGVRLFKDGFKTAIIDSTTWEEANSDVKNWIRQRSRWIKGYLQTYLVHMRNPIAFFKQHKFHAIIFQLIIGLRITFVLINPILWIATIAYFTLYDHVGLTIESLFPSIVFYMAAFSLVFGNFLYLYNYMIGLAKKEHWAVMKYVFLVPFYWMLISVAAVMAFYQLFFKPHYWEKTKHGLHIKKPKDDEKNKEQDAIAIDYADAIKGTSNNLLSRLFETLITFYKDFKKYGISAGAFLIGASIAANFFNYLYNAYLSRKVSIEDFGLISLANSFVFLSSIPLNSLTRTVVYNSGFYLGKFKQPIIPFWKKVRTNVLKIGLVFSAIWILLVPVMQEYFNTSSILPLLLLTPIWILGTAYAVDYGFLEGNLKYYMLGLLLLSESLTRFLFTWVFVSTNTPQFIYAAIPLSMTLTLALAYIFVRTIKSNITENKIIDAQYLKFPTRFFISSLLIKFSTVAFLSFDIILAAHFLDPVQAGGYALISLIGKMIFFTNGLISQFITSIVSYDIGAKNQGQKTFYKILSLSTLFCIAAYLVFGLFGSFTAPLLLGDKILPFVHLLWLYGLGMLLFSISYNIISYNQLNKRHLYTIVSFALAILQIVAISNNHHTIKEFVLVMAVVGALNFIISIVLYVMGDKTLVIERNLIDFVELFASLNLKQQKLKRGKLRILVFNWRDNKHTWAGGAEVYIHEIAKRLVESGHSVTMFCSNDNKNLSYEEIDGIEVIRRGGFFTLYIWAFLYYTFKLRGKFDLVIDSENGIPFFTPLYVKEPVIGLVHHVHQDIILNELKLAWYLIPFALVAKFLETKAMPFVYKKTKMITVSKSTKADMEKIGLGKHSEIDLVHPGIDMQKFSKSQKTEYPSILYLGRLKPYKSIDVVINAMKEVIKHAPEAKLRIAGFGESREYLEKLVKKLKLQNVVEFLGKVTEEEKVKLMGESWVFVYPSAWEGWGISVIEANATGTPVVASNVPGLKDSVSNPHSGFLVEAKNTEKFAEKINLIVNDKKLREELEITSIEWAGNFTWDKSLDNLKKVFKKVL